VDKVAKDFDPMEEIDNLFYNIINEEDWDIQFDLDDTDPNLEELVIDLEAPVFFEYLVPGPMDGVLIKIMMRRLNDKQQNNFMKFFQNIGNFLEDEDKKYG
jgi:hypothetical protein